MQAETHVKTTGPKLAVTVWRTDQTECYDSNGNPISCGGTGQDGELRDGMPWPVPRFVQEDSTVMDRLTGLMWSRSASLLSFPVTWDEAFEEIAGMNRKRLFGFSDWRLPERRELFSLVSHHNVNPALPDSNPFEEVFTGYYWTATPCSRLPLEAWYVHLGGGRVFMGMKHGSYMLWPVRRFADVNGSNPFNECRKFPGGDYKSNFGKRVDLRAVDHFSSERWERSGNRVIDHANDLMWWKERFSNGKPVNWARAFDIVEAMNRHAMGGFDDWRLPNIREAASLVDTRSHSPALPSQFGDTVVQPGCWTSTSSALDPSYAWVLYSRDGALGVGYKVKEDFQALAVRSLKGRMKQING